MGVDWHLVQHIPASVAHSIHSLGFCAPPCRDVRRTRVPWSSTRASAQAIRARRVGAGRPHGLYRPHMDPRIPHRATQLSCERSLHPCMLLTVCRGPTLDPPEPRHDEHEREVHAGLARGHCTARGDCSRSRGRRIAHLRLVQLVPYLCLPPGKVTNSTRARGIRSWLLVSVVRSECSWPLRRPDPVGSMLFGRRVGVVPVARRPSRRVPLTGLRRSPGHLQLPTSGKARCACCARRGRSGAPRGSPASLRRARPTRRFPH